MGAHTPSRISTATFPGWVLGGILSRVLIATSSLWTTFCLAKVNLSSAYLSKTKLMLFIQVPTK